MTTYRSFLDQRRAGVLLHLSSLPGSPQLGHLGGTARRFVDYLSSIGSTVWQVLPLGPTHLNGSPYQTLSVHANNPHFIDLEWLFHQGWLRTLPEPTETQEQAPSTYHARALIQAYQGFVQHASEETRHHFNAYKEQHSNWLDDYSLFMVLRNEYPGVEWQQWPLAVRNRDPKALTTARLCHQKDIEQYCFEQYVFHCQWSELRSYAADREIRLLGDMPIFVAGDSDAVWANPELFELKEDGYPRVVAGVPPDYFAETGQLWGNPLYNWSVMENDGFDWWMGRLRSQLELFDCVRFDHFRALESYWEIPGDAETAIDGQWVKAPGNALLNKCIETFGSLPLIAEDLGIITAEVEQLRDDFELPGMKVLQFAFGGGSDNIHLPHWHIPNCVTYTGTHDNDTSLGWYETLDQHTQHHLHDYLGHPNDAPVWALIRAAMASTALLTVIPMQDILELNSHHRMNTPGTVENNWSWKFDWPQLQHAQTEKIRHFTYLYGRKT